MEKKLHKNDIVEELYRTFRDTDRVPETARVREIEIRISEMQKKLLEYLPEEISSELDDMIGYYGNAYLHMGFMGGYAVAKEILK